MNTKTVLATDKRGLRTLGLITLGFILCVSLLNGGDAHGTSQVGLPVALQSPIVLPSPTPQPRSEAKRPNAVRRFFSWTAGQLARPFRKEPPFVCGLTLVVTSVTPSKSLINFCPLVSSNLSCSPDREVTVVANAAAADNDTLLYTWSVTAGTIRGEGREVSWDLGGVAEGSYTATVEISDGSQHTANGSTTVTVAVCPGCDPPPPPCPTISVSCPENLASQSITFEAVVAGGDPEMKPGYTWSISAGKIVAGQGTSKITVDISERGGRSVTATVLLNGAHPACSNQASCTLSH